ncbi:MAG: ribonuclease H-like domain-containing protein [Candidatus Magasanikbacteria bacterium]|nr:ribonuclease H-like domain-containing protein [Candidatus Magasanikbacteria bacterium]
MSKEIVFDIETQNTFADVNNDFTKLRVSVISLYRYETDAYESYTEDELGKVWPLFERADRLIGFNSEHFDLPILNNYYPGDLLKLPSLDIMKEVKANVGIRLKLDSIAEATLDNIKKSADGLTALRWWKEGRVDDVKKYCEQDVRVTKEIYEFGKTNSQLFYKNLVGEVLPFRVNFTMPKVGLGGSQKINLTLPF